MKFFIVAVILVPSAFPQIPSVPCIPPPAPAAAPANANQAKGGANQAKGGANQAKGGAPAQQPAAEVAEIAKLMNLPTWGQNLANGDYSHGPGYPTAPEL